MTEQDLIDNGFKRIMVPHEESNNGFDYHFYSKEITRGLTLISTDSTCVEDDKWSIVSWDLADLLIETVEDLKLLETAIKKVTNV